jgi:hypothetical protein
MAACVPYEYRAEPPESPNWCQPKESDIAFFGAVDTRPHLFLMTVTLLSVHRFHPHAGLFLLIPLRNNQTGVDIREWRKLLHGWSAGATIQPLVTQQVEGIGAIRKGAGGYSPMTFHRHAVPEMLAALGYTWSINLDPDVLTVRPWDFSPLLHVRLIAGRPVGRGSRTAEWLQVRLDQLDAATGKGQDVDSRARLQGFLRNTLNTTARDLERTCEINGGVLVFNNRGATEMQWWRTVMQRYGQLSHVVEGDQDLISATARVACLMTLV